MDLRFGVIGHQNGNDIKAVFHVPYSKDSPVDLGGARNLSLLTGIDRGDDRRKFIRPPRFNLDETKGLAIQRDEVDLAGDLHAFAVASDRDFEICYYETVVIFREIFGGQSLAALAEVLSFVYWDV